MRKVVGVIVGLIGLALIGIGVAGAVTVGSDDVWGPPAQQLDGDAAVMISGPALLAHRSGTLRVTAANASGQVFLGVAHPVDVASLTAGVTTLEVSEANRAGLRSRLTLAERPAPAVNPQSVAIWSARVSGSGSQTLNVPLTGAVQQLYVGPVGKAGPLTAHVGFVLPGAHRASLAAITVGVVLTGLGGFLLVRRGRGGTSDTAESAAASSVISNADGALTKPAGSERIGHTSARRARLSSLVVTGLVAVPVLSGCVALPEKAAPWDPKTVTKPSLTVTDMAGLWKAYDVANNVAIKRAASPTFDPSGWTVVDTDGVLMGDRYSTAYAKEKKSKTPGTPFTHRGTAVYAPAMHAYPAQAIVAAVSGSPKADPSLSQLSFHRKESVTTRWQMAISVGVPTKSLPQSLPAGATSTPSAGERKAAIAASQNVLTYLNTGRVKGVALDARLKRFRANLADTSVAKGQASATFFNRASDQTSPHGSVHPVKTAAGTLVLAQFLSTTEWRAASDSTIFWTDTTHAEITGQAGNRSVILDREVISVAILVGAGPRIGYRPGDLTLWVTEVRTDPRVSAT